ncbi:MAG: PCMD domain-containing protein [Prevotella sp.]|nr:PCMD domain-containing protein [Prevotella sp.]
MRKFFTSIMLLTSSLAATATDYQGTLAVVINGDVAQPTTNLITLNEQDGKYELALKNFILMEGDEAMPVGNIVLKDVQATDEQGAIVLETNQDILIEAGDIPGIPLWLGTILGPVPVELRAVVSGDGDILTADIKIPLADQDVQVVFDSRTFQLPNSGFEEFHTVTAKGGLFGTTTATSEEPNNWHSFMSCTGSLASMVNTVPHTFISTEVRPGSNGSKSVLVKSGTVSMLGGFITATANGTLTTGQLKAGDGDPASTKNNAFIDLTNEAKDANGDPFYTVLNTLPDAISVWVKFKQGEVVAEHPYATMSAVITDGSYYQEPTDKDYSEIIVGEARNNKIESTGDEWQKITVPFEYANKDKLPKAILVTFSTNADPGQGTSNDELYIDDVELIYNSSLADLSINGETLSNFDPDTYNYEYDLGDDTTVDEIIDNISYKVAGKEAHGIVSVLENNTMAIAVLSADLLSSHTYTIKFKGGATGIENIVSAENTGKTIYNLNGQKVNSMKKGEVYITKYANGKIVKSINK